MLPLKTLFVVEIYSSIPLQNIHDSKQHLLLKITGFITSNSNIHDKSEFQGSLNSVLE
jgi:hypothetical protein